MLGQQRQACILELVRERGARAGQRPGRAARRLRHDDPPRPRGAGRARAWSTRCTAGPPRRVGAQHRRARLRAKSARQRARRTPSPRARPRWCDPGSAIGLSAGTTTCDAGPRSCSTCPDLTVVTNSVPVADVFYTRPPAPTRPSCSPAACARRRTRWSGRSPSRRCARCNVDIVFLGVHGMDDRSRLHHPQPAGGRDQPAPWSQAARRLVVVADHTKWGVVGISTIAALDEADVVIVDDELDPRRNRHWRERCPRCLLASPAEPDLSASQTGQRPSGRSCLPEAPRRPSVALTRILIRC